MTSKALKRLSAGKENYDLSVDLFSTGKQGEVGVKATLTIFSPGVDGKPGTTQRRTVGLGTGADIKTAEAMAVESALNSAGV